MCGFRWGVGLVLVLLLAPRAGLAQQGKGNPDLDKAKEQIIAGTNRFRKEEKRPELKVNPELTKAAQTFAEFMARTDKYGHEADGKKPADRVTAAGYQYCIVAENIAYLFSSAGFTTDELAQGFLDGWKKSPPHRKNLLDPDLTEIGVGLARSSESGKYYAVQNFGRPKSKEIQVQIVNRTGETVKYTLGGESFSIEPRYTVTHRLCRPSDLQLEQPGGKAADKEKPLHLEGDARYVLSKDNAGKYQLEKE